MASTTRVLPLSRFSDLSLHPQNPKSPISHQNNNSIKPFHFIKRQQSLPQLHRYSSSFNPSVVNCVFSGVDGGGLADEFVSTNRKSGYFDREFSVIENMLKKIEPLDTSVISSAFDQSNGEKGEGTSVVMQQIPQQEMMPPVLAEEKKRLKVLVAIDESEGSFYALKWALDNLFTSGGDAAASTEPADQTQNPVLMYLLNIQQPFQHYIFPAAGPAVYAAATTSIIESVRKTHEQNSTMLLSRASQICRPRSVEVEALMMEGDPKDMICEATEKMQTDLVVVGSRGLGNMKRAFLGSVSDYCAHHAKCPVLIVKPPQ